MTLKTPQDAKGMPGAKASGLSVEACIGVEVCAHLAARELADYIGERLDGEPCHRIILLGGSEWTRWVDGKLDEIVEGDDDDADEARESIENGEEARGLFDKYRLPFLQGLEDSDSYYEFIQSGESIDPMDENDWIRWVLEEEQWMKSK